MKDDAIFKALSDPTRRHLLDVLFSNSGRTLNELCADLEISRQGVTKHLKILEAANLVATMKRGREKLHYLNAVPIQEIADRWVNKYSREHVRAIADLKTALESEEDNKREE